LIADERVIIAYERDSNKADIEIWDIRNLAKAQTSIQTPNSSFPNALTLDHPNLYVSYQTNLAVYDLALNKWQPLVKNLGTRLKTLSSDSSLVIAKSSVEHALNQFAIPSILFTKNR
jgi:hypothetical protein